MKVTPKVPAFNSLGPYFFPLKAKPTIFILEKTLRLLKMMCSGQNMKTSFRRGHLAGPDVIGQRLHFQKHLLLQGGFFRAMNCDQGSFLPLLMDLLRNLHMILLSKKAV